MGEILASEFGLRVGKILAVELSSQSLPGGGNLSSRAVTSVRNRRGKLPWVHLPVGQMRGACRLVFMFSSEKNPIKGTLNEGSERGKLLQQSGDSGGIS